MFTDTEYMESSTRTRTFRTAAAIGLFAICAINVSEVRAQQEAERVGP